MDIKSDALKSLCRTCMTTSAENARSIYEMTTDSSAGPTIIEILESVYPPIQVQTEDSNLPKIMCLICTQQLQITYEFLQKYKDTDEKLQKLLKEAVVEEEFIDARYDGPTQKVQEDVLMIEENTRNAYSEVTGMHLQNILAEDESTAELTDSQFNNATDDEWTLRRNSKKKSPKTTTDKRKPKSRKPSKQLGEKLIDEHVPPPANEDGSISCQECEKVLTNITRWQEHMLDHGTTKLHKKPGRKKATPRRFECEYCGKVFPTITLFNNHVRIHTGEQPYLCIECGKSFNVNSSLNVHMLRHKGEKKYQCPHCPKNFVCGSALYGHMKRHDTAKPFVCDICGSAFHMAYQLKMHSRYHNNIRNYACEYCDKRFVTSEKQQRHMRTHTGEKPYRCRYCDRAYAQSNDCNKHMKQHLGDNIHQCELCPLRFPLVRYLRLHYATHKGEDEETRSRNLEARAEDERKLKIKFGIKEEQNV